MIINSINFKSRKQNSKPKKKRTYIFKIPIDIVKHVKIFETQDFITFNKNVYT